MDLRECVRIALASLRVNKLRSALTLLGIMIGVASVIAMISMGEGARQTVTGELEGLGSNMIWVQLDPMDEDVRAGRVQNLTLEDVDAIRAYASSVTALAPEAMGKATIKWGNRHEDVTFGCTTESFLALRSLEVASGRFLTDADVTSRRQVIVLGGKLAERLFKDKRPLGEKVKLGDMQFTVVGVLERKGESGFVQDESTGDMLCYIPVSLARRATGSNRVPVVFAQAAGVNSVARAVGQIEAVLRRRYGENHRFVVNSTESILKSASTILGVFTVVLGGIGSISLLVGGIGVMNIMLVSVTERTREIGIRKAVGARRSDVLTQFVSEAVVLCLAGGAVGVVLGSVLSAVISSLAGWPTHVSVYAIFLAFAFSTLVGIVFGVYPAYKAAHLDPIEALRYQ